MTVIVEEKATERKRRVSNLRVVEIQHVQVPDAEDRLQRVFRILMSSFDNSENEAKRA